VKEILKERVVAYSFFRVDNNAGRHHIPCLYDEAQQHEREIPSQ